MNLNNNELVEEKITNIIRNFFGDRIDIFTVVPSSNIVASHTCQHYIEILKLK